MNEIATVGGKLALICVVAAVALGLVNAVTAPRIAEVKERQLAEALEAVTGGRSAGAVVPVESHQVVTAYYPLAAEQGRDAGYILNIVAAGYGGDMNLLAGFSANGELFNAALMDNLETPGLGKNAEKPEYMEMFIGTGGDTPVPVTKLQLSQAQADAVSGASITFMGLGQAISAGADFVKELGK